ncbi:MAG TPA: YlxR family protein [Clostridia bacterium]|nr:YlxR family protein [Clostridia bacterium]
MKTKKIPMRMCTGCKQRNPKKEMIRVVRSAEGVVSIDKTGKASGRGAYICPKPECLQAAVKSKALERALETTIDTSLYEKLKEELAVE